MQEKAQKRKLATIVNTQRLGKDNDWVKGLWHEYFSDAEWIEPKDWFDAQSVASCYIGMSKGEPLYLQSVGGDGSHNALANAYLARNDATNIVLGFVPTGTGNDTTRPLGFDSLRKLRGKKESSIEEYLLPFIMSQKIDNYEHIIRMDAGKAILQSENEKFIRFFVNTFGMGYFAEVNNASSDDSQGEKNYIHTALQLRKEHAKSDGFALDKMYHASHDECHVHYHNAVSFDVMNGLDFGNKMRINPKGNIIDGSMEAFIMKSAKAIPFYRNLAQVFLRTQGHLRDKNIMYEKGFHEIGSGFSSPQAAQADGEAIEKGKKMYTQVNIKVLPQILPVVSAYKQ